MVFDSSEFQVQKNEEYNELKWQMPYNKLTNFDKYHIGTSIGFKNIASKIAYDLRLWLGANDPPTKDVLYELNNSDTTKTDNEPGTKSSNKGMSYIGLICIIRDVK